MDESTTDTATIADTAKDVAKDLGKELAVTVIGVAGALALVAGTTKVIDVIRARKARKTDA